MAAQNSLALAAAQQRFNPYHGIQLVNQPPSAALLGQKYTANMDKNDIRAVENARQRYSQLTHTLTSFQNTLIHSENLPPW